MSTKSLIVRVRLTTDGASIFVDMHDVETGDWRSRDTHTLDQAEALANDILRLVALARGIPKQ